MTRARASVHSSPRRLLTRPEAAAYCGVSVPTFNDQLRSGSMPAPLQWPSVNRMLWDLRALDAAIDALADPADAKDEWRMTT